MQNSYATPNFFSEMVLGPSTASSSESIFCMSAEGRIDTIFDTFCSLLYLFSDQWVNVLFLRGVVLLSHDIFYFSLFNHCALNVNKHILSWKFFTKISRNIRPQNILLWVSFSHVMNIRFLWMGVGLYLWYMEQEGGLVKLTKSCIVWCRQNFHFPWPLAPLFWKKKTINFWDILKKAHFHDKRGVVWLMGVGVRIHISISKWETIFYRWKVLYIF